MGSRIMVSLCDYTAAMAEPWAAHGYTCYCVDVQHPEGETRDGNIILVGADVTTWELPEGDIRFVASFPPCTDLAVSGARWFKEKGLRGLIQALTIVNACKELAEASGAPWFVENPVSTISTYWRQPDHRFHPYEYGGYEGGENDGYTKKTCLWTGGGFIMPEPAPIELDEATHNRIHFASPGPERGNIRSATPRGFARAVFEANHRVGVRRR